MTRWAVGKAILLGSIVAAAIPLSAQATTGHAAHGHTASHHGARSGHHSIAYRHGHYGHYGHLARYAGISCVPFARAESGIVLTGNAATWWDEAEGRYARGHAPQPGSVLNFRANATMHMGHVAVVRNVINARQIEIDQANWWGPGAGRGRISRDIAVVDVSPHNDWTSVRVALGHSGTFGSVYPTYGFIYAHGDGVQYAGAGSHGSAPVNQNDEVAEAPANAASGPLTLDAPDRNLR